MSKFISHDGGYIVRLSSGTDRTRLPKGVYLDGSEYLTVVNGRVASAGDGFIFTVKDSPVFPHRTGGEFVYAHHEIEEIWSTGGRRLWPDPDPA